MSWLRNKFRSRLIRGVRWVVIDCETSGLDPARERLLAIGAVAVRGERIELADSFGATLQQAEPSAAHNILVHGIGADAQLAGEPPEQVLPAFTRYLGDGVAAAFHAPFDSQVLERAMAGVPGASAPRQWLDLAALAPALRPQEARRCKLLDDWLGAFGIETHARHEALADAFAAAQLLLALLAEAKRQRIDTLEGLQRAGRERRWLLPH
ncbi:MAG TPA: 3'-5' exonuclease [Burkholderiales bacterium]|jgi:DNA polymerase-3 subunit epsilon|nr:3'-5' exonuclease [Burkholderiales bacterium]